MPDTRINSAFLAGEIHALVTFSQVMASMFRTNERFRVEFEAAEQVGLANVEKMRVPDSTVEGYQFVMARLRGILDRPLESD